MRYPSRHQGAQSRRLPGLPVVLLSSISAAFLTVVCRPRQALTPSLVLAWLPKLRLHARCRCRTHRAQW